MPARERTMEDKFIFILTYLVAKLFYTWDLSVCLFVLPFVCRLIAWPLSSLHLSTPMRYLCYYSLTWQKPILVSNKHFMVLKTSKQYKNWFPSLKTSYCDVYLILTPLISQKIESTSHFVFIPIKYLSICS